MKIKVITQDKEEVFYTGNEMFWTNPVCITNNKKKELLYVTLYMDDEIIGSFHTMNETIKVVDRILSSEELEIEI